MKMEGWNLNLYKLRAVRVNVEAVCSTLWLEE